MHLQYLNNKEKHFRIKFNAQWVFWRNFEYTESDIAQSCPALCDPMDCSLPGVNVPEAQLPYWQNGNNAIKCILCKHLALCLAHISIPGNLLIFDHWSITKPSYLNSKGYSPWVAKSQTRLSEFTFSVFKISPKNPLCIEFYPKMFLFVVQIL